MLKKIKDNPVSSLDKKFTKEDMCSFGLFLGTNLRKHKNQRIDVLLDEFLQNGVENSNEQLKPFRCKCTGFMTLNCECN